MEYRKQFSKRKGRGNLPPMHTIPDRSYSDYYCKICDSHMNCREMWDSHINGKRHQQNVNDPTGAIEWTIKDPFAKPLIDEKLKDINDPIVGLKFISEIRKSDPLLGPTYKCYLCGASLATEAILIDHLYTLKHKLAYIKEVDSNGLKMILNLGFSNESLLNVVNEYASSMEHKNGRGIMTVEFEKPASDEPYYPKYYKKNKKSKRPCPSLKQLREVSSEDTSSSVSGHYSYGLYRDRSPVNKPRSHKIRNSRSRKRINSNSKSYSKEKQSYDWRMHHSYDWKRKHIKTLRSYDKERRDYRLTSIGASHGLTSSGDSDTLEELYSQERYGPNPFPKEQLLMQKIKNEPCSSNRRSQNVDIFLQAERSLASETSSSEIQQQQKSKPLVCMSPQQSSSRESAVNDFIEMFQSSGVSLSVLLDWLENLKVPINPLSKKDCDTLKSIAVNMFKAVNKYKSAKKEKSTNKRNLQSDCQEQNEEVQDNPQAIPSSDNIVITPGINDDSNKDHQQHNSSSPIIQNFIKQCDSLPQSIPLGPPSHIKEHLYGLKLVAPNDSPKDCSLPQIIKTHPLSIKTEQYNYQEPVQHLENTYQSGMGDSSQNAMEHSDQNTYQAAMGVPSSAVVTVNSSDYVGYPTLEKVKCSSVAIHSSVVMNQSALGSISPHPLRLGNFLLRSMPPIRPQNLISFMPRCFTSFVPRSMNPFMHRGIDPIVPQNFTFCNPLNALQPYNRVTSQDFMNRLNNATQKPNQINPPEEGSN